MLSLRIICDEMVSDEILHLETFSSALVLYVPGANFTKIYISTLLHIYISTFFAFLHFYISVIMYVLCLWVCNVDLPEQQQEGGRMST